VAFNANGSLTVQNGGAVRTDLTLDVGTNAGNSASLLVHSGGTVSSVYAGIGNFPGGVGTATVTGAGSTWTNSGDPNGSAFTIGDSGTPTGVGSLTVANGGAVTTSGQFQVLSSGSSVVVNGGTLTAGSLGTAPGAAPTVQITDPAGGAALTIGTDNSSSTYTGPIADAAGGPGTVRKVGTGTFTLTGHLTNTGGYTAAGGTIDFSGAVVQPGPGSLTAAAGTTIQYDSGTRVFGGFLGGPGTHVVTGGSALSGSAADASAVVNVTGAATFSHFSNSGSFSVAAGLAAVPSLSSFINQGSGSVTIGAGSKLTVSDFQTYGTITLAPGPSAVSATRLTNAGTSQLSFNGGSRTFVGTPATAGQNLALVDLHGHNAVVAGGLFVNNGFVGDSSGQGASVIADYGALVKGAGTYQSAVITQNGGKFQVGNSPGISRAESLILGPGGTSAFNWQINNATGTAGPTPDANNQVSGWSLLSVEKLIDPFTGQLSSGDLNWTATSVAGTQFNMSLQTLINPITVGQDTQGAMANFNNLQPYAWKFVSWQGTYTGPTDDAALSATVLFDASNFVNTLDPAGKFSLHYDGVAKEIEVIYAVPEPGSLTLGGLAAIGWVAYWRRRWAAGPASSAVNA
jgi:T5SS/PEP-CTERM-associated repeat protein